MNRLIAVIVIVILMALAVGVSAQEDGMPRVQVQTAEVQRTPDGRLVLQVQGTLPTGCELPVQAVQTLVDGTLRVDLVQHLLPDALCPAILLEFAQVIPLAFDAAFSAVEVNGQPVAFDAQDLPEAQGLAEAPSPAHHLIDSLDLIRDPQTGLLTLVISGQIEFQCGNLPVVIKVEQFGTDWLAVEVYQEIPANVRCSAEPETFQYRIPVPQFENFSAEGSYPVIEVNGFMRIVDVTNSTAEAMTLVPAERLDVPVEFASISALAIEGEATRLTIDLSGTMPDGCLRPLRLRQVDGEADVNLALYTAVQTAEVACPRILRSFELSEVIGTDLPFGQYQYSLNGELGAFDVQQGFRSLHVVEALDVLILESFPEQINLVVSGYIPDGCEIPHVVEVIREGDRFEISVYRPMSMAMACPMMIVPFEETISLGAIGLGDYTFVVNGFEASLES